MEQRAEKTKKIAVILAPDDKGLRTVFGIPTVRRLILLLQEAGLTEIHIIGRVEAFKPILSDRLSPEKFHPAKDPASLGRALERQAA